MPLIETAIAFVAAMLAASLFVSALVQLLQNGLHYRGRTVVEMLKTLLNGFLVYHNDPDALVVDDPKKSKKKDPKGYTEAKKRIDARLDQFAHDVLSDPALHSREVKLEYGDDDEKLASLIEYIHPDDLIGLAYNYAESYPPGKHAEGEPGFPRPVEPASEAPSTVTAVAARKLPNQWLPEVWVGMNTGADNKAAPKPYATAANFASYVDRWFATIEATHSQQFKRRIRRLTVGVSCLVVVLFCLDGLQLIRTLYHSRTAADQLAKQADTLQATASRLGVAGSAGSTELDKTAKDLLLELQKTSSILDDAAVGIGWQNSWITRRWCAFKGVCKDNEMPTTAGRLFLDLMVWLFGLIFSCVMLSLGAPFWVSTMGKLIKFQNDVENRRQEPDTTPPPAK
jgi:hypothetical protein